MVISLYASVRSPPAARKFSTGNASATPAGSLQANVNLSPPARNRSRSRSPATQRKSNVNNISPEPSQVIYLWAKWVSSWPSDFENFLLDRQLKRHFWRPRRVSHVAQCRQAHVGWLTSERSRVLWRPHQRPTFQLSKFHWLKMNPSLLKLSQRPEWWTTMVPTSTRTSVITEAKSAMKGTDRWDSFSRTTPSESRCTVRCRTKMQKQMVSHKRRCICWPNSNRVLYLSQQGV